MLVDAKVYELKKRFHFDAKLIKQYLLDNYISDHR